MGKEGSDSFHRGPNTSTESLGSEGNKPQPTPFQHPGLSARGAPAPLGAGQAALRSPVREVAESPCADVKARSKGARRAELMPLGLRICISDLEWFYATKIPSTWI